MGGSVAISCLSPSCGDENASKNDDLSIKEEVNYKFNGEVVYRYLGDLADPEAGGMRMLLISDNLQLFELLIRSAAESVLVVPMSFECQTVEQLQDAVRLRAGEPRNTYASIGIIDHGDKDELCFARSEKLFTKLKNIQGDPEAEGFFMFLAGFLRKPPDSCPPDCPEHRIDLLTCHAEDPKVLAVLRYLTRLIGFNVVASLNDEVTETEEDAGAEKQPRILEMRLDADEWYFYESCLELWRDSVLASAPVSMKEMRKRKHAAVERSAKSMLSSKADRRALQLESIRRQRDVLKGCFRQASLSEMVKDVSS